MSFYEVESDTLVLAQTVVYLNFTHRLKPYKTKITDFFVVLKLRMGQGQYPDWVGLGVRGWVTGLGVALTAWKKISLLFTWF